MAETKLGQDAVTLPVGTTAQRPANPEAGMIRFNTDTGQVEGYNDRIDVWQPINQPFQQILATGGTVSDITQDGVLYRVHTFTSNGRFEVTAGGGEVDVLVVGGGGGGGYTNAAGGGAGGLVFVPNESVTAGSYQVLVGEGGEMSPTGSTSTDGFPGGDSQIFSIKGLGGGAGGSSGGQRSRDGGSGGGRGTTGSSGIGLQPSEPGISGEFGFGNDGGSNAGGGGGAGEPGDSQSSGIGGDGLNQVLINGVIYNFKDMFGTNVGHSVGGEIYFAGGGHSARDIDDNSALSFPFDGALGSGSPAFSRTSTGPALPNTGGGGSGNNSTGKTRGTGGSGVVIVRYELYELG